MPTGGSWPYSRVSARRNCDDAIDRLGRRRRAQPKPDFPRPLRIRPRTTSHIAEEQQQGTATRDVCGISPPWSPPRSGLARLVRRFRAGMYTGSRKPAVDYARGDNKTCRLAGSFTRATGLEPATSGVTGVPKPFQRVSPRRRIGKEHIQTGQLPSAISGASRNCGSTACPLPTATRANLRVRRRAVHTV